VSDWNALVREEGPSVFGIAWRILGHAADAEDVVQEVFLEAHRLRQTRAVRNWPGFLRRLATCRALDRLRQRKPVVSLDHLSLEAPSHGPEAVAVAKELAQRLRAAVARLPEREGAVFCLRYYEDLSYQQIADTLNVSPGAVAVALHKARARLEEMLAEVVRGE
jgi:RNA polymerase sigma-70 factor (ECF subfamily)